MRSTNHFLCWQYWLWGLMICTENHTNNQQMTLIFTVTICLCLSWASSAIASEEKQPDTPRHTWARARAHGGGRALEQQLNLSFFGSLLLVFSQMAVINSPVVYISLISTPLPLTLHTMKPKKMSSRIHLLSALRTQEWERLFFVIRGHF